MNKSVKPEQLTLEVRPEVAEAIAKANQLIAEAADPDDDFDWNNPDEESIVLTEQRATAVYRNKAGEIIIRQRCWPDDDSLVFISPENEIAFMEGMAAKLRK